MASFEIEGDEFEQAWDLVYSESLPSSGYQPDERCCFEQTLLRRVSGCDGPVRFRKQRHDISDFGRSLTSNGTGTDHGWGGHAFVMGGAVNGGDIYGKMPQLVLDSPDAWSDRMIPTTAMEEYLATIVKWFGATEAELNTIFPNLSTFTTNDMGFMGLLD